MAAKSQSAALYFILGPSYHGAGALSWALNRHPDILSLGTGNPQRGEDQACSCGHTVSTCPFWAEIGKKNERAEDDPFDTWLPQSPFLATNKTLNSWLNGGLSLLANEAGEKCWRSVYEQSERFAKMHYTFLENAHQLAPHKAFADAERSNLKFMVMASMGFPVKGVAHLVRDPRGYAASCKKYYPESTAEKLALEWVAAHTRIKRLKQFFTDVPFIEVRYENLVNDSAAESARVAAFMGLDSPESEKMSDPLKNHLLGLGSQDAGGDLSETAENWRESLHPEDQERVISAVGTLFSEFGYKS